jgi:hypothetical protein
MKIKILIFALVSLDSSQKLDAIITELLVKKKFIKKKRLKTKKKIYFLIFHFLKVKKYFFFKFKNIK